MYKHILRIPTRLFIMSSLTDEQRKMIEEKKKAAQAKLLAKFPVKNIPKPVVSNNNNHFAPSKTSLPALPSSNTKTACTNSKKSLNNLKSVIFRGSCELISKERFTVHVPYHQQLINIFKTMPSRNYGI